MLFFYLLYSTFSILSFCTSPIPPSLFRKQRILMPSDDKPIAFCLLNDVEAFEFPFFIKKGVGVESDQLLLEIHLWHMTSEEKAAAGELLQINESKDLQDAGYKTDDRGVYIIGETESWMPGPEFGPIE